MGLSLKYFIYDEEANNLIPIPISKFNKLFNFDPSVSLKEYAGSRIKYITVVVQLENRKPIAITDIGYHIMQIDENGMFDRDFINDLSLSVGEMIAIPMSELPENVIDKSSDFAKKKFNVKYSWIPSSAIENKVIEIIFIN